MSKLWAFIAITVLVTAMVVTVTRHTERQCSITPISTTQQSSIVEINCNVPSDIYTDGTFYARLNEPFHGQIEINRHFDQLQIITE